MGARQYAPALGRFLSVDPLFEKFPSQGADNYSFNNPLNWKDPSGLEPVDEKGNKVQGMEPVTFVENEILELMRSGDLYDGSSGDFLSCDSWMLRKFIASFSYDVFSGLGVGENIEMNEDGHVVSRSINNLHKDIVYLVDDDGNRKKDEDGKVLSLILEPDTIGETIEIEHTDPEGNVRKVTCSQISDEASAVRLFEFLADCRPRETECHTSVEWALNTYKKDDKEIIFVGTSHEYGENTMSNALWEKKNGGYQYLIEGIHNHWDAHRTWLGFGKIDKTQCSDNDMFNAKAWL